MFSNIYLVDEIINKDKDRIANISEKRNELMFGKSCEGAFWSLGSVVITMLVIKGGGFVIN